jgi:hypothetical protein
MVRPARRRYATAHELGTFAYCPRAWFYETCRDGGGGPGGRGRPDPAFERGLQVHHRLEGVHLADGQVALSQPTRTRFPFGLVAGAILLILLGAIVWTLLSS